MNLIPEIQQIIVSIVVSICLFIIVKVFSKKGYTELTEHNYQSSGVFFSFVVLTIVVYLILQIWVF